MFKVVFVCTGNRCRSPLAEACLRKAVPEPWLEVSSTGTLDLGPVELGIDLSGHRARPLEGAGLADADLVVGMTLEHVASASVNGGAPAERSFALVELTELLRKTETPRAEDPEARARAVVEGAQALRLAGVSFAPATDITDPLGGPRRLYRQVTEQIGELCNELASALTGRVS